MRRRCLIILLLLCASASAYTMERRNFTEFNFSAELPSDWIILQEGDYLYITDHPWKDGRWDGMGYLLIAVKDVNSSLMHQSWMSDSFSLMDSLPERTFGNPPKLKTYGWIADSWEHPNGRIYFIKKSMTSYTVLDPKDPNRDTGLIYNSDDRLYSGIYISMRYYYERKKAVPDIYIVTSFGRLCDASCPYNDSIKGLGKALEKEGHTVEVVDLGMPYDPSDGYGEGVDISSAFREQAVITENTTILIIGSYDVLPPCYYTHPLVTRQEPAPTATRPDHFLISDDCYATNGSWPSEAVIARLPVYDEEEGVAYLDRMAGYHLQRARGAKGLNTDRLEQQGKPCYSDKLYDLFYMEDYIHLLSGDEVDLEKHDGESSGSWQSYPVQYFALHGNPANDGWTGTGGSVAVDRTPQEYPFSAMSLSCYGGLAHGSSIPNAWLFEQEGYENRPSVFIGSTGVSYFSGHWSMPTGSDLVLEGYHDGLESGKTAGRALADAKRKVYSYGYDEGLLEGAAYLLDSVLMDGRVTAMNRAAGLDFQLYGDPFLTKEDMVRSNSTGCSYD